VVTLGLADEANFSWFGVFDGHGGSFTSAYSSRQVLAKITATPEWKADRKNIENLKRAIVRGFLELDEELRQQPEVQRGDDHSGSTAITSLVTPTHILVGNCGDSRAILVRGGEVVEMSFDHKPYNEGEQRRIEAAGGTVTMRRVNGDLAVSRALGDFVYKHVRDLPAEAQQVSGEPEVKVEERTDADQVRCNGNGVEGLLYEETGQSHHSLVSGSLDRYHLRWQLTVPPYPIRAPSRLRVVSGAGVRWRVGRDVQQGGWRLCAEAH
jgi:hypothetical protein